MFRRKDWHKLLALTLFIMLLGSYYDRLSIEARTMILPLAVIILAAFIFTRLRRFEHEMRSTTILAQGIASQVFSLLDDDGRERISISTATENAVVTFYDKDHQTRAVLDLFDTGPGMKLVGEKGSILIAFDDDGIPHLSLRGDADEILWEAPVR